MSISGIVEKSRNLNDLDYIEGKITGVEYIKHKKTNRRRTSYNTILVLSIQGSSDKFGFPESSAAYKTLSGMKKTGRNAKIYYDSSGQRIEFGITLHIFNLTIGNYNVIDMSKKNKEGLPVTLIFISGTLISLIIFISILKQFKQKWSKSLYRIKSGN